MTKPSAIKQKSRCPGHCMKLPYTPVPADLWVMLTGLGEQQQLQKPQCFPSLSPGPFRIVTHLANSGNDPQLCLLCPVLAGTSGSVHTKGSWALPLYGLHNTQ